MPSDVRNLNWFSDQLTKISALSTGKFFLFEVKKNLIVNFISLMSLYKLENNVMLHLVLSSVPNFHSGFFP